MSRYIAKFITNNEKRRFSTDDQLKEIRHLQMVCVIKFMFEFVMFVFYLE
jgi:hypothetical protein